MNLPPWNPVVEFEPLPDAAATGGPDLARELFALATWLDELAADLYVAGGKLDGRPLSPGGRVRSALVRHVAGARRRAAQLRDLAVTAIKAGSPEGPDPLRAALVPFARRAADMDRLYPGAPSDAECYVSVGECRQAAAALACREGGAK